MDVIIHASVTGYLYLIGRMIGFERHPTIVLSTADGQIACSSNPLDKSVEDMIHRDLTFRARVTGRKIHAVDAIVVSDHPRFGGCILINVEDR